MDQAIREKATREQATRNECFGCGPDNPEGLHLSFLVETRDSKGTEETTASATTVLGRRYQGSSGFAHGGIIATLMDEVMSKLNRPLAGRAVTRHLEVEYLKPVPIEVPLTLSARHLRREGRKLFHEANLKGADGQVLAQAKGFFILIERKSSLESSV